jgi:amino acid transporter
MEERGQISFFAAVLLAMNIMIGAGIYVLPQNLAVTANSFGFLSWILAATLLFPVIWGVAQASKIFPGEGGFYNYCKCGIGPKAGFFANWAYLLGYLGTAAAITGFIRLHISTQFGLAILEQHAVLFNFLLIALVTLLNLASVEMISKIQGGATILKLTPLFFVLIIFVFYLKPSMEFNYDYLPNLPFAIPLALFAFWGFESCCGIGHMIKGGASQVPKVMFTAFFAVTAIYTLFHFGIIHIMGIENLKLFGAAAFPRFLGFGESATYLINLGISCAILLSLANTLYGISLLNITNLFTLADKNHCQGQVG